MSATTPPTGPRPIRVLWLIKGLGPGGAEQLLVSSAEVAEHKNVRYHAAYVRPDKNQLVPALAARGVEATPLGGTGHWDRVAWPLRLRRLMRHADIVHAHSPLPAGVARLLARTLPRAERPVTVSTEHNVWPNFTLPTRILNAVTAPLDGYRWAVSAEVRRSMGRLMAAGTEPLRHGIVLSSGATDPHLRARVRSELGLPDDAVVAITVANFRKEKDYPNVMRAAKLALDAAPGLHFLAVGQGPLVTEITDDHQRLGLGDKFRLLGYRSDVPDLLAASDIFVLGSMHEGLPVAIMEALAAGLPVVATNVGGVPEAVTQRSGIVVPSRNSSALAAGVVRLATNEALRHELAAGARLLSSSFDIRTAVDRQETIYGRLTCSPP